MLIVSVLFFFSVIKTVLYSGDRGTPLQAETGRFWYQGYKPVSTLVWPTMSCLLIQQIPGGDLRKNKKTAKALQRRTITVFVFLKTALLKDIVAEDGIKCKFLRSFSLLGKMVE